jgi:hypothetical protein
VSGQLHAPAALPPAERAPVTHWIGGWVDLRAGLDNLEKKKFLTLPGLELRPVDSRYTDYAIPAHAASNTGIYCSSDKVVARLYSVQCTVQYCAVQQLCLRKSSE